MKVKTKLVLGAAALSAVTSLMVWAFTFQAGVNNISGERIYHSLSNVTDTKIDQSGFTVKGATDKVFSWNKKSGVNANFALTGGNLSVGSDSLFLDTVEAVSVASATATLHNSIEVDAGKITADLDGGIY